MSKIGEKPSEWLPDWIAKRGYELQDYTTLNDVALAFGLASHHFRALKRDHPDLYPVAAFPVPANRQVFKAGAFDAVLRAAGYYKVKSGPENEGMDSAEQPANQAPAEPSAPLADVPPPREPERVTGPVGRLARENAKNRLALARDVKAKDQTEAEIEDLTARILELDSGTGQSAAEARATEIAEMEAKIAELRQRIRELRKHHSRTEHLTADDLPRLRRDLRTLLELVELQSRVIEGDQARIQVVHQQLLRKGAEVDDGEDPQISDTPADVLLMRRVAAGELKTVAGAAVVLGIDERQVREVKRRAGNAWPESEGKAPDGRAELYPFEQVQELCHKYAASYAKDDAPAAA